MLVQVSRPESFIGPSPDGSIEDKFKTLESSASGDAQIFHPSRETWMSGLGRDFKVLGVSGKNVLQ